MDNDIKKILLTEEQIRQRICELGEEITRDYAGKFPVVVGVLKGVVVFYSDMVRQIKAPIQMDFMTLSSYKGTRGGELEVKSHVSADLTGRDVLILEDIYDTGNSLTFICEYLKSRGAASVKICTLLDKPEGRKPGITLKADYVGFVVPNEFVVGYGLDYNEKYRNLPYVGVLKPEVYKS